MALSPGIPTSFVPRQPVETKRPVHSGVNLFLILSLAVLGISVLAAVGMFGYNYYLKSSLEAKAAELAAAEARVNEGTIEDFVRLRDRLASGGDLLSNQVVLSKFMDTLEELTLQNVRFNSMEVIVANDRTATIEAEGTARTFNALAAQSNAFAQVRGIKRAIFSDIALSDTRLVTFTLTADVDNDLLTAGDEVIAAPTDPLTLPPAPATTTTPALERASTTTTATTTPRL